MRTRKRRRLLATTLTTAAVTLLWAGQALASITPQPNTPAGALAIANAMASPLANVTGASYVSVPASGTPNGTSSTLVGGFPTSGSSYGILTSGDVGVVDSSGTFASTDLNGGSTTDGPHARGNTDFDVSILKVDLSVPQGANCLTFDFKFLSEEFPGYVNTQFNDAFIAELDTSTWTTSGSTISAPDNFAFDAANNVVSINSTGIGGMSAPNGAGTAYDGAVTYGSAGFSPPNGDGPAGGATVLLHASHQVTAGAHSLYLSIFDQGDQILDSAVFLDNLRTGFVPNPSVNCVPGAEPVQYILSLTPASATNHTGTQHTVTATLTDSTGIPVDNATIAFTVAGVNPTSGSGTTNSSGQTTFTYTGTNVGSDSIGACYDADNIPPCEAVGSATKVWTNTPPVVNAGGPYSGNEGSAVALSGATATDPDGDPLTYSWSYLPGAGVDAGATCSFSDATVLNPTITCTDDGTFVTTLSVTDGFSPPVTSSANVVVANVNPVIGAITSPSAGDLFAVGSGPSLSASFSDAGTNDTHTCSINWDDGVTSSGAVSEVNGAGTCTDSHTYSSAGVYTIQVTVTDDDGGFDTKSVMVVVYDSGAGFVTGGGWIDSPPGAYTADPSLSGRATFGFVSKYLKGATTPIGQTEFQFSAAGFNFHSESYQWLVVSGPKAQYKGNGTVDGVSGFRFLLTATDGQMPGGGGVDKFRIKVWDIATSTVVYDNVLGASDDIDTANPQAIGGGSIVIHKS